jgi:putative transposase
LAKEAELICRKGRWYFNLVVEADDADQVASGSVMGKEKKNDWQ